MDSIDLKESIDIKKEIFGGKPVFSRVRSLPIPNSQRGKSISSKSNNWKNTSKGKGYSQELQMPDFQSVASQIRYPDEYQGYDYPDYEQQDSGNNFNIENIQKNFKDNNNYSIVSRCRKHYRFIILLILLMFIEFAKEYYNGVISVVPIVGSIFDPIYNVIASGIGALIPDVIKTSINNLLSLFWWGLVFFSLIVILIF
jgi:hypothetical protein